MGKLIKFPNKEKQEKRASLYLDHLNRRIKRPSSQETSDRLENIRKSLEKINTLMAELKKIKGK